MLKSDQWTPKHTSLMFALTICIMSLSIGNVDIGVVYLINVCDLYSGNITLRTFHTLKMFHAKNKESSRECRVHAISRVNN